MVWQEGTQLGALPGIQEKAGCQALLRECCETALVTHLRPAHVLGSPEGAPSWNRTLLGPLPDASRTVLGGGVYPSLLRSPHWGSKLACPLPQEIWSTSYDCFTTGKLRPREEKAIRSERCPGVFLPSL